jgi:hypothetical protein
MLKKISIFSILLISFNLFATEDKSLQIEDLKKRITELEEIQKESSEILKRQLADQHYDQSSRGFIELKLGLSNFSPKDIEDVNDELFNELEDASWNSFGHAWLIDLEIGKTILSQNQSKHEISIGYQNLRSSMDGKFTSSSGDKIKIFENVSIHTIFARYANLYKTDHSEKFFFGPGVTLGYSPVTNINIEAESGNEGAQINGEGTSYLLELFGKSKYEISRYFSLVSTAGYRLQEADNLRLNAAEIVSVKTKVDLDASGFFVNVGLAASF